MEKTTGFRIITYRFRLYCEQEQWLLETKKIYNRVLGFYYDILKQEQGLMELNKLKLMRRLEVLSIGTKEEDAKYPIPFEKVPLYFRRAAINDAIRLYRSFEAGKEHGTKQAECFDTSPVYYKGMYKDFFENSIVLKLYDGECWHWTSCRLDTCGRTIPSPEKMLSPTLKIEGSPTMLHIPVKEEVSDVRTVKARLDAGENICAVAFPSNDCMAVLVIMSQDGEFIESRFIRGGKELSHRRRVLLKRLEENRKCMGYGKGKIEEPTEDDKELHLDAVLNESVAKVSRTLPPEENKSIKKKLHRITDDTAHKISREIVNFCKDRGISLIVVPNYKQSLDLNSMGYMAANNYDWLGRRIISYLKYKSFGEGIITATASTKNIASKCYQCGATVKKYNGENRPGANYYGGKNFVCPNGHRGNSYFNSAMNVGRNFLQDKCVMKEIQK